MGRSSIQQGRPLLFALSMILLVSTTMAFRPFLRGSQRAPMLFTKDEMEIKHAFVSNVEKNQPTVKECDEECLDRRTLVAHTDYIYTQEHKNP
ncbi:hypothetical protein SUGI_0901710 [Cryptomeria japonica]|uniref:uncharacterized protein LOC131858182 n=1 Tax=Cryptomeria japonica TaxID=3369 RepID=UPI002414BCFD|nr:uncharacterized protein LOC131858182 [Cryptomeria japonica]GLJ43397.1 hypothetical protein SUGI_0901710 [Cryptomeria japonica]